MDKYCLLNKNGGEWWMDSGNMWTIDGCGFAKESFNFPILDSAHVENFADLDHKKTYLNRPNGDAGWLSREGRFYGCPIGNHHLYARYILKEEQEFLEGRGWLKIMSRSKGYWTGYYRLARSDEQRDWINYEQQR